MECLVQVSAISPPIRLGVSVEMLEVVGHQRATHVHGSLISTLEPGWKSGFWALNWPRLLFVGIWWVTAHRRLLCLCLLYSIKIKEHEIKNYNIKVYYLYLTADLRSQKKLVKLKIN